MAKKAIQSFEPGETVYFEHPYTLQGEFVCFVAAGQAVSELIPEDVPYNRYHYRVDVSKRDRVLVRRVRPVINKVVEYFALMPGAVRKEEVLE